MIDYIKVTPPYHLENENRERRTWNKIIGLFYRLLGYVIAEPIIVCRGKARLDGATRYVILLRGGNLKLWVGRDHNRSGQKLKSKGFIQKKKAKVLEHSGLRMRKVEKKEQYQKGKYGLVLGDRKNFIFV